MMELLKFANGWFHAALGPGSDMAADEIRQDWGFLYFQNIQLVWNTILQR